MNKYIWKLKYANVNKEKKKTWKSKLTNEQMAKI